MTVIVAAGRRRGALACVVVACAAAILGGFLVSATPAGAAEIDVRGELECLALTIYFEARGENKLGKLAVGHVVMNRAQNPLFPPEVCQVVRQGGEKLRYGCQFTWWCDGRSDQPRNRQAWERSKTLARAIYWDYSRDPTAGALWYHAETAQPPWRNKLTRSGKIGHHIFYRMVETGGEWKLSEPIPASYHPD
jgi:spore germination cell wall hydrolase CwlJ-like protein